MQIITDENILPFILLGIIIIQILFIIRLEIKFKRILAGKNARSLEDSISALIKNVEGLNEHKKDSSNYLKKIDDRVKKSIQGTETVRFNAFKGSGSGGNQSFSTVFINETGDGVVLTSLHSRERVSIFSKPLKTFESEFELLDEEIQVIDKAKSKLLH